MTDMEKSEIGGYIVNCPTHPTCFAHFDLCICRLFYNKCQMRNVKETQQGNQLDFLGQGWAVIGLWSQYKFRTIPIRAVSNEWTTTAGDIRENELL